MRAVLCRIIGLSLFLAGCLAWAAGGEPFPFPLPLTVTPYADVMRFVVEDSSVQELRLEIFSLSGSEFFDSGYQAGRVLDWKLLDMRGRPVANGVYLYAVTVKDRSGHVSQKLGKLVILRGRQGLPSAPPISLPAVSQLERAQPQHAGSWDVDHGANAYTINASAVGIGTQNPTNLLQVVSTATVSAFTRVAAGDGGNRNAFLLERDNAPAVTNDSVAFTFRLKRGDGTYINVAGARGVLESASGAGAGAFAFATKGVGDTFEVERMRITSTGNVGLGTSDPQEKLHVIGNVRIGSFLQLDGAALPALSPAGMARLAMDSATNTLRFSQNGAAFREIQARVTGTCAAGTAMGTINGDGTVACNSFLGTAGGWTDDGPTVRLATATDSVGIGTSNICPSTKFQVALDPGACPSTVTSIFGETNVGAGVFGYSTSGYGVYGASSSGFAGYFHRNVNAGGDYTDHVVAIENPSIGSAPDVLALKVRTTGDPGAAVNFITFFDGDSDTNTLGAIQGNGAGGVELAGPGNDFAESLPRLDPEEEMGPGDIVGLFAGKITKATKGAQHLQVISTGPIVVGNSPAREEEEYLYEKVAFLGQVPVKVRGPVRAGDYIVPSGRDDGTGVAISPQALQPEHYAQVVGRAWATSAEPGVKLIKMVVGLPFLAPELATALLKREGEIRELRAANETLRAQLETVEQMVHELKAALKR